MRPRVFISSTYYDLKYLRERIELFLERFNFEPILFESDKLTYEHGKPVDGAAYEEVLLCNMMVLIVGGRYGSPASNNTDLEEWQNKYDEDFVSITRKEYETALKNNIPVFILIDKNVYSEFQSFNDNKAFFEKLIKTGGVKKGEYKFSHVDSPSVFYFIESLKQKPVKTFEKVEEIESYLGNQFSGMFFLYLKKLQEESNGQKVLDSVSELNNAVKRMDEMVSGIGKNLLGPQDFQKIVANQQSILIGFIAEKILSFIHFKNNSFDEFKYDTKETSEMALYVSTLIFEYLVLMPDLPELRGLDVRKNYDDMDKAETIIIEILNQKIRAKYPTIIIEQISYHQIVWLIERRVEPVLSFNNYREKIISALSNEIDSNILPF
jgi:hypothetical protein